MSDLWQYNDEEGGAGDGVQPPIDGEDSDREEYDDAVNTVAQARISDV